MKSLVLIANSFPYSNREPYLETESLFYDEAFDHTYICSLIFDNAEINKKRDLNITKLSQIVVKRSSLLRYFIGSLNVLIDANFYKELKHLLSSNRFSLRRLKQLFVFISRSHLEVSKIIPQLKENGLLTDSEGVFYSYRFEFQAYIALLLKKKYPNMKAVARGHRFDLYEERRKTDYIPLRKTLLKELDRVIMISDDGVNYLKEKYPDSSNHIELSRLGTLDYGLGPLPDYNGDIHIVSCSSLSPVKRVELIIDALALIDNVNIVWHHYGEGPLEKELKDKALASLGSNIKYHFHGYVNNQQLMEIYKNQAFHAFINVSSSEGVPVSIMEAMSFGIPIIATNAGGTGEIVNDKRDGYLLDVDFDLESLKIAILDLGNRELNKEMRQNARKDWEENCNANKIYPAFLKSIIN